MAKSKPSKPFVSLSSANKSAGIGDIIAGGVKAAEKAFNAWQPKYGDPQSLAEVKANAPKVLRLVDQMVTGGMVEAVDKALFPSRIGDSPDVRAAKQKAANKNLAVTTAVNVAGIVAGVGVGKAVGKGAQVLKESGVVNRIINNVTKTELVIHASPTQGLTHLDPFSNTAISSNTPLKDTPFVFVKKPTLEPGMTENIAKYTGTSNTNYKAGWGPIRGTNRAVSPNGSIYIAKAPKDLPSSMSLFGEEVDAATRVSKKPLKVVSEIKIPATQTQQEAVDIAERQLIKNLKEKGLKIPKTPKTKAVPTKSIDYSELPPLRTAEDNSFLAFQKDLYSNETSNQHFERMYGRNVAKEKRSEQVLQNLDKSFDGSAIQKFQSDLEIHKIAQRKARRNIK